MFLHRSNVITYIIFCLLSIISPSAIAMESSSALHFYGHRKEIRNHTSTTTTEKLNEAATYLTTPPTTSILPTIVITPPEITCDQLSFIFAQLQKEPMSAYERRASFLMLKRTAHEELIRSLEENPGNVVRFAELETKIFLLMEKTEQDQHECCALQADCLVEQPDLDDID